MSSSAFIFPKRRKNWDDLFRLENQYFKFWIFTTNQATSRVIVLYCSVISPYLSMFRQKENENWLCTTSIKLHRLVNRHSALFYIFSILFSSHNYTLFILNSFLCSSNLCQPCMSCLFSGDNSFRFPFLTQTPNICSWNTIGLHWVKQRKWLSHYYKEKESSFFTYISDEQIKICQ